MKQHLIIKDLKKGSKEQLAKLEAWYKEEHKKENYYTQSDIIMLEGLEVPLLTIGQILEILSSLNLNGYILEHKDQVYSISYREHTFENEILIDLVWDCLIENY